MNGPRVQVTLSIGKDVFGTLLGDAFEHGPSQILIDGTWPARLVDREDWEYLPGEEPEADRG